MDTLRGTLMSLGIVLHSAQVYNPERSWLIYAADSSLVAGTIVDAVRVFRMPVFFIVSGFFCVLTLHHYAPKQFLRIRMQRILIPLVCAAILLNPLQALILNASGWTHVSFHSYLTSDSCIAHLWFLVNLVFYLVGAWLLWIYCRPGARLVADTLEALVNRVSMYTVVLMLPFLEVAVRALNKIGFPLYTHIFGIISVENLIVYIPFFAIGALMHARSDLLRRFSLVNPLYSIVLIALATLLSWSIMPIENMAEKILSEYLHGLRIWASASLCFYVFCNLLNTESKLSYAIADASYTVYLFHHALVVLFGLLLIDLGLPPLVGLVTLVLLAGTTSYAIHLLFVTKVPMARLLFNGK